MIDRGIIKWQHFNSCFNSEKIILDIDKKKNRIKYPILSEDQIMDLENKLKDSYNLKIIINIKYYYDGCIEFIKGKIKYLDWQEKKIYINNINIYLSQILEISDIF